MKHVQYEPIGIIHTPFEDSAGMPIQPAAASGAEGEVEIYLPYVEGLRDLEGFFHIILLYHFHRSGGAELIVTPFLDTAAHGVFATRAPARPNPIGLSVVVLRGVDGSKLQVTNVDMLNGTPLIDIKPYIPQFDDVEEVESGWFGSSMRELRGQISDDRFGLKPDGSDDNPPADHDM